MNRRGFLQAALSLGASAIVEPIVEPWARKRAYSFPTPGRLSSVDFWDNFRENMQRYAPLQRVPVEVLERAGRLAKQVKVQSGRIEAEYLRRPNNIVMSSLKDCLKVYALR